MSAAESSAILLQRLEKLLNVKATQDYRLTACLKKKISDPLGGKDATIEVRFMPVTAGRRSRLYLAVDVYLGAHSSSGSALSIYRLYRHIEGVLPLAMDCHVMVEGYTTTQREAEIAWNALERIHRLEESDDR